MYIADSSGSQVLIETPSGGSYNGSVVTDWHTNLYFSPSGVAVDASGNVYIANPNNKCVLKESPSGSGYTQTTVSSSGFVDPIGVAVDAAGNVYVVDNYYDGPIYKETPSGAGYTQSVFADSGSEGMTNPTAVAVDSSGNVYFADTYFLLSLGYTYYPAVVKVVTSGGAANFGAAPIQSQGTGVITFFFNSPITLNSATPYQILTMGAPGVSFGDQTGGSTACAAGHTYYSGDYCLVAPLFQPAYSGTQNGAAVLYDSGSNAIATAYLYGSGLGAQIAFSPAAQSVVASGFSGPVGVAVDASGNVYVADLPSNQVTVNGTSIGSGLSSPASVAVDGTGNIYIADRGNSRVLRETPPLVTGGGYSQTVVADSNSPYGLQKPVAVAVDSGGNVYIADAGDQMVYKEIASPAGYVQSTVAPFTAGWGSTGGVAVDGAGNVYIAGSYISANDAENQVVKETPMPDGSYSPTVVADNSIGGLVGTSFVPSGVAVDGVGNVYIADDGEEQVLKMMPASGGGYNQMLLANGSAPYGLASPMGLAVDALGNVFIADPSNYRVLKEGVADPPTLTFGSIADGSASAAQSVEVIDNGNLTLTAYYPGVTVAGSSNVGDFIQVSGSGTPADCTSSFSVAPGDACNLSIEFTPSGPDSGPVSGSATLADNNLGDWYWMQTIALSGTAISSKTPQTITFAPLRETTYGTPPIPLHATASSKLPVTFTVVSGPGTVKGNTLTITGAGTVVVEADQAGNATYMAAPPVQQSLLVDQAPLTVQVNNATRPYGAPNPNFTGKITGLKNGDKVTVNYVTAATTSSPVEPYTINANVSGAALANYSLNVTPGTLTITPANMAITWAPPAPITYGTALSATQLDATATANGGIVTGNFVYTPAAATVLGAGPHTLSVVFTPADPTDYTGATTKSVSINVQPAVLTVTAVSFSVPFNQPIPLTYTITGFVNGDTNSVVSGTPVENTPAKKGSKAGTYPINITPGTLKAANYSFKCVNGTLTIRP